MMKIISIFKKYILYYKNKFDGNISILDLGYLRFNKNATKYSEAKTTEAKLAVQKQLISQLEHAQLPQEIHRFLISFKKNP